MIILGRYPKSEFIEFIYISSELIGDWTDNEMRYFEMMNGERRIKCLFLINCLKNDRNIEHGYRKQSALH